MTMKKTMTMKKIYDDVLSFSLALPYAWQYSFEGHINKL